MKQFIQFIFFLLFCTLCQETFAFPRKEEGQSLAELSRQPFRVYLPTKQTFNIRNRRAEGEQSGPGGGLGEFLSTAIQDGIAGSAAFESPTMFIGGFSMMMQPMPNGTELAGQIMQMAPHYMNFLPKLPGAGRQNEEETNEK